MTHEAAASDRRRPAEAAPADLLQFWDERASIERMAPNTLARAHVWRWAELEPRLRAAGRTVPIEDCERRALVFANPGLSRAPAITDTLFAAFSLYNPGETAPVHRHTPSASRFVVEGEGGYTVVEGEKCTMHRGDLIITPAGTWHDHGNEGSDPVIWMDVLDVPLLAKLNTTFFEFDYGDVLADRSGAHPMSRGYQQLREPEDHSQRLYGVGGLLPLFAPARRGQLGHHSPQFVYRWSRARGALEGLADHPACPYDGVIMEYVNPATGRSVMPNMSFRVQMLRPGEQTRARRRLSSSVVFCLEGQGCTEVDGERLDWGRNDVFALPNWRWIKHVNLTDRPCFLYSVSDEPIIRSAGVYREERILEDGTSQFVVY